MTNETPLGKATAYADRYDPDLLFTIPRAESRVALGLSVDLPFAGCDLWTAWEITWLNPNGVPCIASAEFEVPFDSPCLIESKSLKLYLGSFAMTRVESRSELAGTIAGDLSSSTGSDVQVRLHESKQDTAIHDFDGICIEEFDTQCDSYAVDASLLRAGNGHATETLHSHLLRSLCPVTDQPDLGSVLVKYTGPGIDPVGLLRYIVSYRQHNDFHEACVERMFLDITARCRPEQLTVYARYQRRGGIDINPFRSNFESAPVPGRLPRQ